MNKKTILVVDDEEDIRNTVKSLLERSGYLVICANNGDDALDVLKEHTPDLILLDIMMPGTPVKDVIPKIDKKIKIMFLSVIRTSEIEKENLLKRSNVVDIVQKPYNIDDLLGKIKHFTSTKN